MLGHNLEKNLRKIEAMRAKGDNQRALKQLQEWARRHTDTPHYLYEAAIVAFDLRDYGTGITSLKLLLRAMPDSRDKILRACAERYEEHPALPLCEFLVDHQVGSGRPLEAFTTVESLAPEHLELFQKKTVTRLRSLESTIEQAPDAYEASALTLLAIAHAKEDAEAFGTQCEELLVKLPDRARRVVELCESELEKNNGAAHIRFAHGRASLLLKRVGAASMSLAGAVDRLPDRAAEAMELLEQAKPDAESEAAYHRAIGQLSLSLRDGARAARHLLQAADLDPSIREWLIDRLARAAEPEDKEGLAALLRLRLRLLIVDNRYAEAQPLLDRMRDEELCEPSELKTLLAGHSAGDQRPSELTRLMAENAIAAGDLRGLAQQINSLADHEVGALRAILKALSAAVETQPVEKQLEWRALEAILQSRLHDETAANETLEKLWSDGRFDPEAVFAVTQNCLERMAPHPSLLMALMPWALANDQLESCRVQFQRVCEDLEFDSGELSSELVAFVAQHPEHAKALLALIDSMDRELGLVQKLRFPIALSALLGGDGARAVPEFSVLLLGNSMLREEVLGKVQDAAREHAEDASLQLAVFQILRAEGEPELAAPHLTRALELDPKLILEHSEELDRMLEAASDDATLWRSYCDALLRTRRFVQLDEMCRRATQALPPQEAPHFRLLQAHMLVEDGRLSEGLTILAAQTQSPGFRPERAEEILRTIVRAHPTHADAHMILGDVLASLERIDEAIEAYEIAGHGDRNTLRSVLVKLRDLSNSPDTNASQLVSIATFLRRAGQLELAADIFERAMQLDGELADRILGELSSELRRDEPDLSMMLLGARAARRSGQLERACELLVGVHARDDSRFEAILAELRKLQSEFPTELLPIRDAARVLLERGAEMAAGQILADTAHSERYPLADRIDMLEEFRQRLKDDRRLLVLLAQLNAEAGRVDAATQLLRSCLELPEVDSAAAAEIAAKLQKQNPDRPQLGLVAHDLLILAGRVADALHALPDPALVDDREQAELSERFVPQARRVLDDAALAPRYAESLWRQGRTDEALDVLRTAAERIAGADGEMLWTEYARRKYELGDVAETRRVLERLSRDVSDRRRFYELFDRWNQQRLATEADALRSRLDRDPSPAAALALAQNLLSRGHHGEISGVLAVDPQDQTQRGHRAAILARAHLETGKADLAEALLRPVEGLDLETPMRDEIHFLLAECAERLGRHGESHARYLGLIDSPSVGTKARVRATRNYQQYLDDVSGNYRAVLCKVTELDPGEVPIQEKP